MAKVTKPKNKKISTFNQFIRSIWAFPVALAVILVILTALRLSGSSIGTYYPILYGDKNDPSLLLNNPEGIRSDEWLVTTQLTIAQHAAGYPRINPNIDSGRDMTVVGDAPSKDWSTLFRPQNLAFFVLPFENAFAFKWWLLLYLVIVSCYFFILRILPCKKLLAAILSTATGLSPFLMWWYQTGTLAPFFYGFFILIIVMRVINGEKVKLLTSFRLRYSYLAYVIGLAYLIACFALILYPPFQIPIAITVAIFSLGLFLEAYSTNLLKRESLVKLGLFLIGIILAGVVILAFFHTRENVVSSITNTVYPGKRAVKTEGSSGYEILSTFLQPQLERINRAANYFTSQSEASNFILLLPFMFVPGYLLLFKEYRQKRKINWPLLSIQLVISLFLLYLFVPFLGPLYKILTLDKVANVRLFIGLGFAGVIELLLIIKSLNAVNFRKNASANLSAIYALICFAICLCIGLYARSKYPGFIHSLILILFLVTFFCVILYSFLSKRALVGAILLLLFTAFSVFRIHPLYHGLGPIYNGRIIKAMDNVSKPGDTWAAIDNLYYENFPLLANRDSLSGVKPYPDLSFWRQVDGTKDDFFYNRYAHVIFNDGISRDFVLGSPDSFQVKLACNTFILNHLNYVLSTHIINLSCASKLQEIHYPAITFYIYKIN